MIVWIDLLSGDEMISDSYKHAFIFNDACLEVKAKFVSKNDNIQIASKYPFASEVFRKHSFIAHTHL